MKEQEKETVTLEEGTLRRFRFSNNGFGYPTYPPVIRCDREGKEMCRYDSISISGNSWTIMEESIATKGAAKGHKINRIYIETRAEVIATLAILSKKEDSFVDDIEPEEKEIN